MRTGYVKAHRSMMDHWVYGDADALRAWMGLLWMARYEDGRDKIGADIVDIRAGQLVTTLRSLATLWGWSTWKVKRIILLFEKDGMISVKTFGKAKQARTLITIESWADYQGADQTQTKRKPNDSQTQTKREFAALEEVKKERREEGKNNNPPNPPRGKFGTKEFADALKKMGADESHVADFMAARKKKRAANTETALNRFVSQCEKASVPVADAVRIAAGRSWAGFYDTIADEFHGEKGGRKTDVIPGV